MTLKHKIKISRIAINILQDASLNLMEAKKMMKVEELKQVNA